MVYFIYSDIYHFYGSFFIPNVLSFPFVWGIAFSIAFIIGRKLSYLPSSESPLFYLSFANDIFTG